jgi:hypothetical protein
MRQFIEYNKDCCCKGYIEAGWVGIGLVMQRRHVATFSQPVSNSNEKVAFLKQELERVAKCHAPDPSKVAVCVNTMFLGKIEVSVQGVPSISDEIIRQLSAVWTQSRIDSGKCQMEVQYERTTELPIILLKGQHMFEQAGLDLSAEQSTRRSFFAILMSGGVKVCHMMYCLLATLLSGLRTLSLVLLVQVLTVAALAWIFASKPPSETFAELLPNITSVLNMTGMTTNATTNAT